MNQSIRVYQNQPNRSNQPIYQSINRSDRLSQNQSENLPMRIRKFSHERPCLVLDLYMYTSYSLVCLYIYIPLYLLVRSSTRLLPMNCSCIDSHIFVSNSITSCDALCQTPYRQCGPTHDGTS